MMCPGNGFCDLKLAALLVLCDLFVDRLKTNKRIKENRIQDLDFV